MAIQRRFVLAALLLSISIAVVTGAYAQAGAADVVEFFNPNLDHYFITANAVEATAIDNGGAGPGWSRTGNSFKAGGDTAVCRFYGSQSPGPNSHFYTADAGECASLKQLQASTPASQKRWNFESLDFQAIAPVGGACPAGTTPVFRAYNNGFARNVDSNHRITSSRAAIQQVVARGWSNEGVVMCAVAGAGNPVEVTISSGTLLLVPGESRDVYITITPRNGFTGSVALVVSGLPVGVSQQLSSGDVLVGPDAVSIALRFIVSGSAPATVNPGIVSVNGRTSGGSGSLATLALGIATPGDPVARRLGAVAAVEERCRELSRQSLSPAAFLQGVAAFMATRPEYQASGVDQETLTAWGRFVDGRVHIVAANREPSPLVSSGDERAPGLKAGAELPAATKARLLHSFGPNFEGQTPVDQMRGYLNGKGWTVRAGPDGAADVDMLKGTSGDGFFYLNTHGGRGEVADPSEPDGKMYSIQTSTLVSADAEKALDSDIQALRLVHFTARNGDQIRILGIPVMADWDTRYGITYRFVDAYMRFTNASVVMINACFSSRNSAFVNAFLRQGAGLYLGWSEKLSASTAYQSAPYFVDRMLGANQYSDKESPPQRAFPYDLVLQDMAKKGLDTDSSTGAKLQATKRTGLPYPPIFAPSIRYVRMDEYQELLTLVGEFGADQPKVTVGGTEIAPKSWSPADIVVPLPRTGAGASGDVIVEVRGVKSNARQLSEWSIPLKYSWIDAYGTTGHKFEGTGKIRYRADVGGYRLVPAEAPKYIARGGAPTKDSALPITASGSHTDGDCTRTLSGSGNYVSPAFLNGVPGTVLASGFRIAGDTKQAALGMGFGAITSPHTMTLTGRGCSGVFPIAATMALLDGVANLLADQSDMPSQFPLPALQFTLDAQFGMPALSRSYPDVGGTINVSWTAVPAQTPPRDTADAGK